jgi:hypothetical protein
MEIKAILNICIHLSYIICWLNNLNMSKRKSSDSKNYDKRQHYFRDVDEKLFLKDFDDLEEDPFAKFFAGADLLKVKTREYSSLSTMFERKYEGSTQEKDDDDEKENEISESAKKILDNLDDIAVPFAQFKWIMHDDYFELINRWWILKANNNQYITHRDMLEQCAWIPVLDKISYGDHNCFSGWTYLGIDKRDGLPAFRCEVL